MSTDATPLPPVERLRLESERRLATLVVSLALLPNLAFAFTDSALVANPVTLRWLYLLRASQLVLWLVSLVLIRRASERTALEKLLFVLAFGVIVFVLLVSWLRPADNWWPVRTLIVLSFGTFVALPYGFRNQMIAWSALTAGTIALLWFRYTGMTGVDRSSTLGNFALAGALGMVVAHSRTRLDRDLDAALARERQAIAAHEKTSAELRQLEGIIPICSYCRQVRTEAGAWEGLDQYVRSRTDADFSHGICPTCAQKHFPEIGTPADSKR